MYKYIVDESKKNVIGIILTNALNLFHKSYINIGKKNTEYNYV